MSSLLNGMTTSAPQSKVDKEAKFLNFRHTGASNIVQRGATRRVDDQYDLHAISGARKVQTGCLG